jgi:GT2 family glycosyltransferase
VAEPRFSIIVPVFEHWHRIPALLYALERQNWGGQFELLLVDNGSSRFHAFSALPGFACILRCEQAGSYAARNAGIAAARGEWLIFTDADCVPDADWLTGFDEAIGRGDGKPGLYAGRVHVRAECDAPPNAYQIYDMVKGIPQGRYVRRGYAATANLCVARAVLESIGMFDARRFSGGDAELCRRAGRGGYGLSYVPDATVAHPARDNWHALVTKARRVKGGQLLFGSRPRRLQYLLRTFLPPVLAAGQFVSQRQQPWRYRMTAVAVQFRIWFVDMREALRLGIGADPERR